MKRKLNLVYDDWAVGEENPKPNGVKIYNGLEKVFLKLPQHYPLSLFQKKAGDNF